MLAVFSAQEPDQGSDAEHRAKECEGNAPGIFLMNPNQDRGYRTSQRKTGFPFLIL